MKSLKNIFNLYLTLAFWSMNILYVITSFIPLLVVMALCPKYARAIAVGWARACMGVCFLPVKVIGKENIPQGPVIIACNHTSMLDIHLVLGYFPKPFAFLMKEELFKIPLFGTAVKLLGFLPVNRSNPRRAVETLKAAAASIHNGKSVLIYPEGTRNRENELLPFKMGIMRIAVDAQVPILPIAVVGCSKSLPSTKELMHWHRLEIHIGKPIPAPTENKQNQEIYLENLRQTIQQLKH